MKNTRIVLFRTAFSLGIAAGFLLSTIPADAQLRRPGFAKVKKEDRESSNLVKEDGAIYLEEMMAKEVKVRVTQSTAAYSNLKASRWLGNVNPNQNATLLAVSDKAYRIRAQAKQGQIAGWVSKGAVTGLAPDFEAKLKKFYDRYVIVKELIENEQVALGMTFEEVVASIGPPDLRSASVEASGRVDTLEYVSYERVPQTVMTRDAFGGVVPTTQYVEVENGRVTIELTDNMVTAIRESEGINFAHQGHGVNIPPYIYPF